MSMLPKELVARVRESVDIKTVVEGRGVELRKEGANWKACCPFHEEKTASFVVYEGSQRFQCMAACERGGRGGDVFEFLRLIDGISFPDAVARVAEIGGVVLPARTERSGSDPVSRARAAAEAAARRWETRLWGEEGRTALAYLRSRGLEDVTLRRFRVGLAADSSSESQAALARLGFSPEDLLAAGVAGRGRSGGLYDRFRGRIVFPVTTAAGAVCGFGARVIGGAEGVKWLNGPETPLYRKGQVLFGLQVAREAIRRGGAAVVAEGYVDALALHQAGVAGAVAACGVSLSAEHLRSLRGVGAKRVTLLFDGDDAGARAVPQAALHVLASGLSGYVARMPAGLDPDELALKTGGAALRSVVDGALPLSEWLLGHYAGGLEPGSPAEAKAAAIAALQPYLAAADGVTRPLLEAQIGARLGVPGSVLGAPATPVGPERERDAQTLLAAFVAAVEGGGGLEELARRARRFLGADAPELTRVRTDKGLSR